ncbi:hypothetical protein BK126_22555 [Paenibacillus sp. FSL H7-0326]|uniref:hypothetical protein n=1 Tax=Paenibacillus sp. FSL H7-0326 TaxID=1921144 RepID=UPI00096EE285|nr:hypothetical protein [Paenibacillus sp. FSL H7-0326]OMC65482.1 hypothetical protein BK126_22555 [Paenibacillus sp. FSL H7-0326]
MTYQVNHFKLEPHGWKASIEDTAENDSQAPEREVEVEATYRQLNEEQRAELLEELQEDAYTLYLLLAGGAAELKNSVLISWVKYAVVSCSCNRIACPHIEVALQAAAEWAAADTLRLLDMLGLAREELLTEVFRRWSLESVSTSTSQAASLLERKTQRAGGNSSAILDYIGDAAGNHSLHMPGPEFDAIEVKLSPPGELTPPSSGIAQLVPSVPAEAALEHIRKQVSQRASKWAEELNLKTAKK